MCSEVIDASKTVTQTVRDAKRKALEPHAGSGS
jgi:hypothetical protein